MNWCIVGYYDRRYRVFWTILRYLSDQLFQEYHKLNTGKCFARNHHPIKPPWRESKSNTIWCVFSCVIQICFMSLLDQAYIWLISIISTGFVNIDKFNFLFVEVELYHWWLKEPSLSVWLRHYFVHNICSFVSQSKNICNCFSNSIEWDFVFCVPIPVDIILNCQYSKFISFVHLYSLGDVLNIFLFLRLLFLVFFFLPNVLSVS